jgi:hypothetical protein
MIDRWQWRCEPLSTPGRASSFIRHSGVRLKSSTSFSIQSIQEDISKVALGCGIPFLEEFGIDAIIRYGHPNRQIIRKYRDPSIACTMSFEFGRVDNFARSAWPRFRVRDQTGSEAAAFVVDFARKHVLSVERTIGDLNALFDFLLSNEEPTPWFVSCPAARAAQVIALARQLGIERDRIRTLLDPYEHMIAVDLRSAKTDPDQAAGYVDRYFDQLLSDLARQSPYLH